MKHGNAGTTVYAYTPDGRLLSRTDARGMQTVNTYDTMGRLTQSACDTLVTSYTYGTAGHGKMRVVREETNGVASEYTYDRYGRVTFDKRIYGDGFMSGHTYSYDSLGHVARHTFPSGLNVDYTYDASGHILTMSCNGSEVWHPVSNDGWDFVEGFGNTTITTRLTQAGQLAERYVQYNGSTAKLHRMTFSWGNPRGNLTSRMGVAGAGVTETFSYDSLDRLTGVASGGQATMAMTYADNGNILSKTGMGAYTYSATRPHAVAGVDNTSCLISATAQQVAYNPWGKVSHIEEGTRTQDILYGPDMQRWRVIDRNNGQRTGKHYLHAGYEWRETGGQARLFHYLDNGVLALKVGSNDYWYYHTLTDNVGSVVKVLTGEGTAAFEASYDAWGKPTVTTDQIAFPRGFGGHEMLPLYRLMNMDGRMYDYTLGRFLSPDDYVQEPGSSQSYNRYTYCLNNPLKYTDPSGELFGIDDLIIGTAAFLSSYVGNGLSSHNWGWQSVKKGLFSAGMALVGIHTGVMNGSAWSTAGNVAASNVMNSLMPPMSIPVSKHLSFSASPFFRLGSDGFTIGIYESLNFSTGDFTVSLGGGVGSSYAGWNVGAIIGDWGAGFGMTTYESSVFNGNLLGKQTIGTVSLMYKNNSFSLSNDLFGDGEDRWRTSAAELNLGEISLGTYVYTNHGSEESKIIAGENEKLTDDSKAPILGKNKDGAWRNGKVYFSPFWVGYTHNNQSLRIGYSNPIIQNLTQNAVHKYFTPTPYFLNYDNFKSGIYGYYGRTNPLSIW